MRDLLTAQEGIEALFEEIAPLKEAYRHAAVSFIGQEVERGIAIIHLSMNLAPLRLVPQDRLFRSRSVVAGRFHLDAPFDSYLRSLSLGKAESPFGDLIFSPLGGKPAKFEAFDPQGDSSQGRLTTLVIQGGWAELKKFSQPDLDWELRAHDPPYSDLNDLIADFGVWGPIQGNAVIRIQAFNVAAVQYDSPVSATKARPTVRLAKGLPTEMIGLGIKVITSDAAPRRLFFGGSAMTWNDVAGFPDVIAGSLEIDIPQGAIMQCFVSFNGAALHHGWIRDQSVVPNRLRTVLETFDPQLDSTLRGAAVISNRGKHVSVDFEQSVAATLWMLGFSVFAVGAGHYTTEAVDLVAGTPEGNFLLVECTTGLLKRENKVANLIHRSVEVRRRLLRSGNAASRVVPVIVTSLTREEVSGEADEAERAGVAVYSQEDFQALLNERTLLNSNSDSLFKELEVRLGSLKAASPAPT